MFEQYLPGFHDLVTVSYIVQKCVTFRFAKYFSCFALFSISCYEIHDIIGLEECVSHSLTKEGRSTTLFGLTVRNGGSKKFSHGNFELFKLIF